MNIQNLINQLGLATNPAQMMMNMLSPSQKQVANQFQNKTTQEQAEEIARVWNEKGLTKEQFEKLVKMINKQ